MLKRNKIPMRLDIWGFEVKKGDIVLIATTDSNNLLHAKVIKETPTSLKCEIFDAPDSYKWLNEKIVFRKPEQVIVISNFSCTEA